MRRALVLAAAALAFAQGPRVTLPSGDLPQREVGAGTAVRLDIEGLVEHAELVLEGRVLSRRAVRTTRGRVATEVELDVLRTFLGEERARRTVRVPGGLLPDGSGVLIPGMPTLLEGEDVLLFLTGPSATGARMPVGLAQGKLRVVTAL